MANEYQWQGPHEWLAWKMWQWDEAQIRGALVSVLSILEPDAIQDVFQGEMDDDGYFYPIDTTDDY